MCCHCLRPRLGWSGPEAELEHFVVAVLRINDVVGVGLAVVVGPNDEMEEAVAVEQVA